MKTIILFVSILLLSCSKFEQPIEITDATLTRGVRDLTLRFEVNSPIIADIKIVRDGVTIQQTSINAKGKVVYWYSHPEPLNGYYHAEIIINGLIILIK